MNEAPASKPGSTGNEDGLNAFVLDEDTDSGFVGPPQRRPVRPPKDRKYLRKKKVRKGP